ncbi:MAG: hypothetical protein U5L00_10775 [Desulfovermiculus sp.]|nr:hypothetical protein [Desulfovermiculus sp.]
MLIVIMTTRPWPCPDQGGELEKENPPLAPPYRLEDRRQGGELSKGNEALVMPTALFF